MDTVKFLKTINRMCNNYGSSCNGCPISIEIQRDGDYLGCYSFIKLYPEKVVKIVEEWEKEHPVKTRQSTLLEVFPNTPLGDDGALILCPQDVGEQIGCSDMCSKCRKEFWMEEVE